MLHCHRLRKLKGNAFAGMSCRYGKIGKVAGVILYRFGQKGRCCCVIDRKDTTMLLWQRLRKARQCCCCVTDLGKIGKLPRV
jgi:hypothetical protein